MIKPSRDPGLFALLLTVVFVSTLSAETTVDVSQEWKMHASSAPPVAPALPGVTPASLTTSAPSPADNPCECDSLSTAEKLEQSTYAFTGRVIDAGKVKDGRRALVFDVDETFKGTVTQEMKIIAEVSEKDCNPSFDEGQNYLVYARWEWGSAVTSPCMGTKLLEKANNTALGPSQALKDKLYIRLRNACMGRIDTVCCLASLKAMRADYNIPEPEEGCPDGTVPDRLRCAGSYTWCIAVGAKDHRTP